VPPSLVNIYKELQADLGCAMPRHGDLSKWSYQGECDGVMQPEHVNPRAASAYAIYRRARAQQWLLYVAMTMTCTGLCMVCWYLAGLELATMLPPCRRAAAQHRADCAGWRGQQPQEEGVSEPACSHLLCMPLGWVEA
jgi:hypothetical protein